MEFSGFKFIYMLYSAILTLPLTQKLGQHKIDALMVVKKSLDLNLAISYATHDGSLSLKIIRFDGSFPPIKSTIEKSVIYDMREILASVKGRTLDDLELEMTFTQLLELNPWENFIDLLLKPFNAHDHSNILRINYCIEKLNQMGKHSVHTYLYGLAQTKFMPVHHPNLMDFLQVSVNQEFMQINDKSLRVKLKQTHARFIETIDFEQSPESEWLLVPSINPEQILISLERRPEQFEPLPSADALRFILNCIENQFLKFQDKMSYQDIMTLISGIFSDWEKLSYHGSLGILKADGTPLFVTSMPTGATDPSVPSEEKLSELLHNYFKSDYSKNEFKRMANFVCITHSSENGNSFGINRMSSFEKMKTHFEGCLRNPNTRRRKKSIFGTLCSDNVEMMVDTEHRNEADLEKLPFEKVTSLKIQSNLKTVDRVSKIIMDLQMFKDMVGALIRSDYKTFAVNAAFIASGPLLECLSMKITAKGASMGGSLLGKGLVMSAPFLSRLPITGFHVVVNMRRPMRIIITEKSALLVPADYNAKNSTHVVIHSGLVEPYTTIVSEKLVGSYDILKQNGTNLILTNAYTADDESDVVFIIFIDIFHFDELQTLRLKFNDQVVELSQLFDQGYDAFPDFEDVFDDYD
uniref:Uncharacterized protein n=1 Tax=Romanomermis culicivorax TaxID=13658 RepID=A0A915KQD9_ROMCU